MRQLAVISRFLLTLLVVAGLAFNTWLPGLAATSSAVTAAGIPNAQNVLISGSALLGDQFQTRNGQVTGDIEDAVIHTATGQIWFITLNYGGFLDIGDKTIAVPLSALRWDANGRFVLNFDEQQLRSFPDLGDDWPDLTNAHWMDQIEAFWHNLGFDNGTDAQATQTNQVIRASDLVGFSIGDIGFGDGTAQNLIIDLGQGVVKYAVLAYSTGLFSNRLVPVPLRALNWAPAANQLVFADNINQTVLTNAPQVDADTLDQNSLPATFDDALDRYWAGRGYAAPTIDSTNAMTATNQVTTTSASTTAVTTPQMTDASALPGVAHARNVLLLGSTLLGHNFTSQQGDVDGDVQDLIINTTNGRALYAMLEYGGFLEIGDTELPTPLGAFTWNSNDQLVLNFTENQMDAFPNFGETNPFGNLDLNLANPQWDDPFVTFWRNQGIDPGVNITQTTDTIMFASNLMGYTVNDIGLGTGNVANLVVDLGQSRVTYLLIGYGSGVLNNQIVAVPFSAFKPLSTGNQLVFAQGVDRTLFAAAPHVDRSVLTSTGPLDPTWDDQSNAFWAQHGFAIGQ